MVVKQALPSLCNSISSASIDESWITSSAIDLVNSLINGSKNGLGDGFFALLAPHLFKCLGEADDRDVLQVGLVYMAYVSFSNDIFVEWNHLFDAHCPERL